MSKDDWISCKERFPDTELTYESSFNNKYTSIKPVLAQTKRGELFVAIYIKTTYRKDYKDEHEWFSYGTGGRRMKVMSKVVAWIDLPEKYEGE